MYATFFLVVLQIFEMHLCSKNENMCNKLPIGFRFFSKYFHYLKHLEQSHLAKHKNICTKKFSLTATKHKKASLLAKNK
jgi:hypothetical protein